MFHPFWHTGNPTSADRQLCFDKIEYRYDLKAFAKDYPNSRYYGFYVKQKPIPIDDVIWNMESMSILQEVREAFPDLETHEWDAATRMITMIINAFSPIKRADGSNLVPPYADNQG